MPPTKNDVNFFQRIEAELGARVLPNAPALGSGGFATVYGGELLKDRRACAIKISHATISPTEDAYQKELEVMRQWKGVLGNLPNNLTLFAGPETIADDNGVPRCVAAWERAGGTLRGFQQASFPAGVPREALFPYMEDVAKGLDDYFRVGPDPLVHRDIKPENIFTFQHRAKIGDPALMRSVGATFSMTGHVRGSLEYMPGEAIDEGLVSSTFDRYSFIVTYVNLRLGRNVFSQGLPDGVLQHLQALVTRKQELRVDLAGLDPDERELFVQLAHADYTRRPLDKLTDLLRALGPRAKAVYAASTPQSEPIGPNVKAAYTAPTPLSEPFTREQALAARKHWAVHLGSEPEFTILDNMRFVLIPPGEFTQGSDVCYDEKPPRKRRITQAFYLQTTPTTIGQVLQWLNESGEWDDAWIDLNSANCPIQWQGRQFALKGAACKFGQSADQPMTCINWFGADSFTKWLSKKQRCTYRLAKEVEWEYAARAGSVGKWCFGDDEKLLGEYAWYDKNSGGCTHPVGQKKANAFGLFDVHGNVWQWTADWYGAAFYANSPVDDPFNESPGVSRIIRGGGWGSSAEGCRSSYRYGGGPSSRDEIIGFRVARSSSVQ